VSAIINNGLQILITDGHTRVMGAFKNLPVTENSVSNASSALDQNYDLINNSNSYSKSSVEKIVAGMNRDP
jgi:hypothetical protein